MEARLLQPNVNLEIENNDVLKASQFSVKFVGMNTPTSLPPNMEALPKSFFFTFKFFTFQTVQTEIVQISTTKAIEEGKVEIGNVELAKRYYFIMEDQIKMFKSDKSEILNQILDRGLTVPFEINPLLT